MSVAEGLARLRGWKRKPFWPGLVVLGVLSLAAHVADLSFVVPLADGRENLVAAHNLVAHGVFGSEHRKKGRQRSDNWREPLPAVVLAAAMLVHPELSLDDKDLRCVYGRGDACQERVAYLKLPSLFLTVVAAALAALVVYLVARRAWPAWLCFLGISFAVPITSAVDRFYSEGLAAFLITLLSVAPVLASRAPRRRGLCFGIAGVALALLILTKAMFLFFAPIFAALVGVSEWQRTRSWRRAARGVVMTALPIVLLVGGWSLRNAVVLGTTSLTQRGGLVLYMRAAMNESLAKHRGTAAALYAGGTWSRNAKKHASKAVLDLFDNNKRTNFRNQAYRRWDKIRKKKNSLEAEGLLRKEAVALIRKNPGKHIAMMGPVLLRGTSLGTGYGFANSPSQSGKLGPKHWGLNLTGTLFSLPRSTSWLLFGSLPVCCFLGLARRRRWLFWLALPSCFSLAAFVAMTHFVPRYGIPNLPVAYATVGVGLVALWRWVRSIISSNPIAKWVRLRVPGR